MNLCLILDDIRSMENVGSIFRTADAAGVSKLYLTGITPTPLDRFGAVREDFTKVSLGAERSVPWEYVRSASALIRRLRNDGYKIYAVEQARNSVPYCDIRGIRMYSRIRIALLFGNEVRGLPPSVLKKADKIFEIPMRGAMVRQAHHPRRSGRGKESLNVAVVFGVVVFSLIYSHVPIR